MKSKVKTRKSGLKGYAENLIKLVPLMYSLAITSSVLQIATNVMAKTFAEEIRIRMLEFKLMGVVEVEKRDKHKVTIEYHKLKEIKKYLDNFIKINKKWKYEKEVYCGIETGRYLLTRVYRTYNKKRDGDEDVCSECGREYDDD